MRLPEPDLQPALPSRPTSIPRASRRPPTSGGDPC
jgi:hypothetical protein